MTESTPAGRWESADREMRSKALEQSVKSWTDGVVQTEIIIERAEEFYEFLAKSRTSR